MADRLRNGRVEPPPTVNRRDHTAMSHASGIQLLTTPFPPGSGRSPEGGSEGASQFRADFAAQRHNSAQSGVSGDADAREHPPWAAVARPPAASQSSPGPRVSRNQGVDSAHIRSAATPAVQDPLSLNVQPVDGLLGQGQVVTGGAGLPPPGNNLPPVVDASGKTALIGDPLSELSSDGSDIEEKLLVAPAQGLLDQPQPAPQAATSSMSDKTGLEGAAVDTAQSPMSVLAPTLPAEQVPGVLASEQPRVVPALFKGAFEHSPHADKIREHLQTVPGGKLTSAPPTNAVPPDAPKFPAATALVTEGEPLLETLVAATAPKPDTGAKVAGEIALSAAAGGAGHSTASNLLASLTSVPTPPAVAGALTPFLLQSGDTGAGHIPTLALHTPAGAPGWTGELGNQIRWLLERGGQVAELRLNPAELGSVDVRLSKEGDSTNVMFYTTNAHARELLEAALPRLRDMFAAQGMNLGEADVSEQSLAQHRESPDARNQGGDGSRSNGIPGSADMIGDPGIGVSTAALTPRLVDYYV